MRIPKMVAKLLEERRGHSCNNVVKMRNIKALVSRINTTSKPSRKSKQDYARTNLSASKVGSVDVVYFIFEAEGCTKMRKVASSDLLAAYGKKGRTLLSIYIPVHPKPVYHNRAMLLDWSKARPRLRSVI